MKLRQPQKERDEVATLWIGKPAHSRLKAYADKRGLKLRAAGEQAIQFFLAMKEGADA